MNSVFSGALSTRRTVLGIAILLANLPGVGYADSVFDLGQVDVSSDNIATSTDPSATVVDATTLRDRNQINLAQALQDVPGVTLSSGGQRNEDQVYIRGFDSTQTTLNIDGVPVYVPYD
ncbi:MAG: Plug domain-containing protein, partial [Halothiobacillus sp.]